MLLLKRITILFLLLILSISACSPLAAAALDPAQESPSAAPVTPTKPVTLSVMAAASLTAAFQEMATQFEASHPNTQVEFNFAGSQQLAQQLSQGAPSDVFASANQKQMDAAISAGRIQKGAVKPFVKNRLVVIFPKNNPAKISGLDDLAQSGLKLILAAKEVPAGQYSLDFMDKAAGSGVYAPDYKEQVLANVVSYENNVKSVMAKIALGEGDAGIVYTSDVTGPDANQVGQLPIPDNLNIIASYPIAAIQDSANKALGQEFIDLVLSPHGQAILKKYGFIPVNQ
jgi:molybdate transport system substrate-binding protein